MNTQSLTLFTLATLTTATVLSAADAAAAPQKLTFQKGKMIEAAFFKVRPGQQRRLTQEYFPKALKLAKEYGVKPLGSFQVTKVEHGPADAIAAWGLFEWPSVETKARFEKDRRFRKLRKFRDSLLETLPKQVYLEVEETVTVHLQGDGFYEAAVAWANPARSEHMKQYFAAAGPFIQQRGVKFLGKFKVIGQPSDPRYAFDAQPNVFLLIDWGSADNKAAWFASDDFKRVGWRRALALDRLFIIESRFSVPRS